MKPIFLLLISCALLLGACTRPISTAAPEAASTAGGTRACGAADLQTSSNSNDANGTIVLGVTLVNISKSPCALEGLPQVTLSDGQKPLDVQITQAGDQTPPVPSGLTVAAGESAVVILVWGNYCGPSLKDGATLQLVLANGETLKVKAEAAAVPHCDAKDQPSTLTVNPYSFPP